MWLESGGTGIQNHGSSCHRWHTAGQRTLEAGTWTSCSHGPWSCQWPRHRKWGGWAKSQSPQQGLGGSSDEEGYRSAQPKNRVFFSWELSLKKQWVRKKSILSLGPGYRHLKLNMLNTEAALYPPLLHLNKRHCHSRSWLKTKPKTTSDDCSLPSDSHIQSISDACGFYPQNTSCISYASPFWLPLWSEEPTTLSWTSAVTS